MLDGLFFTHTLFPSPDITAFSGGARMGEYRKKVYQIAAE
jgi:hypothetical protein